MTTLEKIDRHKTCIEILEGIDTFENRINLAQWDIDFGFIRNFPKLVMEYRHRIEIYKMCITRLEERYLNLLNKIK